RTLFFDFLPVNLGKIRGFNVRFQLYTVPGQVYYNATRRLVLKGADAVVFVADSQREMAEKNTESYENMKENLRANGLDPETIPLVIQYNKRDLPNIMEMDEMNRVLNLRGVPFNAATAVTGEGVLDTFKLVTRELMQALRTRNEAEDLQQAGATPTPASTPIATQDQSVSASQPLHGAPAQNWDAAGGQPQAGPVSGSATSEKLEEAVIQVQNQIVKIETQLDALLVREASIEELLAQIKNRLDSGETGERPVLLEPEEAIILEDEQPKKRRFFWNR
ncbi:MAG: GTPase domain-containing protein, partial [bacterium]|nr:GTPase domain-containing protein [bacterium]